jgi:hypothetical protein
MMSIGWSLVDAASRLLEREEREAVRGDLTEAGEGPVQQLVDLLSLVVRREVAVWNNWRPWAAAFGLALPGSLLLMGLSVSVSLRYERVLAIGLTADSGLPMLLCQVLLLIGWSWIGGFVVGSLSRQTLWASVAAMCLPCLFCLSRFHIQSLSSPCLFLFILPGIWGVRDGLRRICIKPTLAIALAVVMTILMIPGWTRTSWIFNGALIWPTWYLAAKAQKTSSQIVRR